MKITDQINTEIAYQIRRGFEARRAYILGQMADAFAVGVSNKTKAGWAEYMMRCNDAQIELGLTPMHGEAL